MTWLQSPIFIILGTQLLFTASDLMARAYMKENSFELATFMSWWFVIYLLIRQVATFGQLFIFANMEVGKTMALFGASSIIIVNILGIFLLGEFLSTQSYIAIALVVIAFVILAFSP